MATPSFLKPPIEAVLFDLGNVLLNLDFDATARAFAELGAKNFRALWTPLKQEPFFEHFETGHLAAAAFRDRLRQTLDLQHIDDAALDAAWNAMILDLPAAHVALLRRLRQDYRVYLLSNTNEIHLHEVERVRCAPHGLDSLASLFDHAYYSHQIGARKPEAAAYAHVLQGIGLPGHKVLFIDDFLMNIEAARQAGLQAVHLPAGTPLETLL